MLRTPERELLPEERNSQAEAAYRLNAVLMRPVGEPRVSYGLMSTRMLSAPQTPELLDIDSMLSNRYDIIGKCGRIYKSEQDSGAMQDGVLPGDEGVVEPLLALNDTATDTFLQRYSDRDSRQLRDQERPQLYIRDDVNTRYIPYIPQYEYVDTRAQAKERSVHFSNSL